MNVPLIAICIKYSPIFAAQQYGQINHNEVAPINAIVNIPIKELTIIVTNIPILRIRRKHKGTSHIDAKMIKQHPIIILEILYTAATGAHKYSDDNKRAKNKHAISNFYTNTMTLENSNFSKLIGNDLTE